MAVPIIHCIYLSTMIPCFYLPTVFTRRVYNCNTIIIRYRSFGRTRLQIAIREQHTRPYYRYMIYNITRTRARDGVQPPRCDGDLFIVYDDPPGDGAAVMITAIVYIIYIQYIHRRYYIYIPTVSVVTINPDSYYIPSAGVTYTYQYIITVIISLSRFTSPIRIPYIYI